MPYWSGLLVPYNKVSSDGRMFAGPVGSRYLPLALRWVRRQGEAHDGAEAVGTIDRLESREDGLYGFGYIFDPAEATGVQREAASAALTLLSRGLGGISVDVVDASRKMAGDAVQIVGGNLAAATLLDIPAFGDARVALQTDEAEPVVAGLCATFDLHVETVESPVESFAVTGSTDLPIADSGREWDGDAAADAIFAWAREDGGDLNVSKASRGFFFHAGDGQNEGDYKLPFATVTDGELTIVPRGVYAVASVLEGGRGGVDIPEAAQRDIRGKVRTIYRRMDQTVPWDTDSSESSSAESVESFEVLGATDLPIADRDKEWDAAQAVDHMFAAATDDEGNLDLERLQQGFFYRNPDRGADAEWAYKLPFADVFGSTLTIVPNAVFAAAAVVQGARAPVDIPADQIEGIKSKIARIYERMDRVAPWLRTESDEEAGMCPECQQRRDTLMETARNELVERLDARVEAAGV